MRQHWIVLLALCAACSDAEPEASRLSPPPPMASDVDTAIAGTPLLMATVLDTAISTESGLLAFPVDLGIDSAGRVFVGDSQSKYVVLWDPDSRSSTIIGRPGQGPGEFGEIVSLRVLGSELLVADPANARIQRFDLDGDLLGQSSLNPLARVSTPYIEADGTLLISSFGSERLLRAETR